MLRTFVLIFIVLAAVYATEPTNFDYEEHGDDWPDCPKNGTQQSPILLTSTQGVSKQKDSYLFCDYYNTTGTVNFLNTTIYISTTDDFGSAYTRTATDVSIPFKANEIRVRMHSEHKTQEGYYDLELQIAHVQLYPYPSRNARFSVGLFFNEGPTPDPFLQQIIDAYEKSQTSATINVDLSYLLPKNVIDDFWFYVGSITIPACTNGKMNWIVSKKVHSMTKEQKTKLTEILSQGKEKWGGNWRRIQERNGNILGYRSLTNLIA